MVSVCGAVVPQLVVAAPALHQLVVGPVLHYLPALQDVDLVRALDRTQPVRDRDRGPPNLGCVQRVLPSIFLSRMFFCFSGLPY